MAIRLIGSTNGDRFFNRKKGAIAFLKKSRKCIKEAKAFRRLFWETYFE
jgi:hypothetical protein